MKSPKADRPMMDSPDLYLMGFIVIYDWPFLSAVLLF